MDGVSLTVARIAAKGIQKESGHEKSSYETKLTLNRKKLFSCKFLLPNHFFSLLSKKNVILYVSVILMSE